MIPTTPQAQRIATLFHRRPTTPWSPKEIRTFKQLQIDPTDLDLLEAYYKSERAKGDKGIHRRDLFTFLNNYPGELDRAREWETRKVKKVGRIAFVRPNGEKPLSEEEFKEAGAIAIQQLRELRRSLKPNKK